jgi:CRP-like cAMP-binding protein
MSPQSPPPAQPAGEEQARTISRLFAEIQVLAKARDFKGAEELREKLIEINPMALNEIIQSTEIIEREKSAGIDRDHLAIWARLYDLLSEEEGNCLFYSMKKVVVPPKKLLLVHGAQNNRLFLIDRGQVTIFFPKDGKNILLTQLGRGDILGEYAFSAISLNSASAVTHSEVQLMYLDSSEADDWEEKHPGLYQKLIDFCRKNGKVDESMRNRKLEKRRDVRIPVAGQVTAHLLTREGKKSEVIFRGGLSDISMDGTCFTIRCTKKATARALLARYLFLSISCERGGAPITFTAIGRVVRVSFHLYEDYSIHVQFNQLLAGELYKRLES